MSTANPENILCTHPNQFPKFEVDVIPGTDWELAQYGLHEFYAYRWDEENIQMSHIVDEHGFDAVFASRDEAIEACKQFEELKA